MEETAVKEHSYVQPELHQQADEYSPDRIAQHHTLGQMFVQAREFHKLNVSDIAKKLYLTEDKIHAIEQERLDVFDAPIYARGCVEAYAKLVGIPKNLWQPLLAKLGYQTAPKIRLTESDPIQIKKSLAKINKPTSYTNMHHGKQGRLWIIAGVLFALFLLSCWWGFRAPTKIAQPQNTNIPLNINQGS